MDKEKVIICDLDGTLAIFEIWDVNKPSAKPSRLRNPYDASKADEIDLINKPLALLLDGFVTANPERKILFLSGREDKFREATKKFLQRDELFHLFDENRLFMRTTGDTRPDEVVKKELYEQNIKDKYDVLCVFDDRPKVIRMWRSLGLYVFDCGRGIEF